MNPVWLETASSFSVEDRQQEGSSFKWWLLADMGTIPWAGSCGTRDSFWQSFTILLRSQCLRTLPPLDFSPTVTMVDTYRKSLERIPPASGRAQLRLMPARHSADTVLKNFLLEATGLWIIPISATNPNQVLDDIMGKWMNKTCIYWVIIKCSLIPRLHHQIIDKIINVQQFTAAVWTKPKSQQLLPHSSKKKPKTKIHCLPLMTT